MNESTTLDTQDFEEAKTKITADIKELVAKINAGQVEALAIVYATPDPEGKDNYVGCKTITFGEPGKRGLFHMIVAHLFTSVMGDKVVAVSLDELFNTIGADGENPPELNG